LPGLSEEGSHLKNKKKETKKKKKTNKQQKRINRKEKREKISLISRLATAGTHFKELIHLKSLPK
jgi:hypothetical protein